MKELVLPMKSNSLPWHNDLINHDEFSYFLYRHKINWQVWCPFKYSILIAGPISYRRFQNIVLHMFLTFFFRCDMMHSRSTTMQTIFHCHIVDELSFPIEIPSQQKLQNDSYSYSKRCMTSNAIKVVRCILFSPPYSYYNCWPLENLFITKTVFSKESKRCILF